MKKLLSINIEVAIFLLLTIVLAVRVCIKGLDNLNLDIWAVWSTCAVTYLCLYGKIARKWTIAATIVSLTIVLFVGLTVSENHEITPGFLFGGFIMTAAYGTALIACGFGLWFVWVIICEIYKNIRRLTKRHR